jgi:uncharacterized protein (DUF1330 family)
MRITLNLLLILPQNPGKQLIIMDGARYMVRSCEIADLAGTPPSAADFIAFSAQENCVNFFVSQARRFA